MHICPWNVTKSSKAEKNGGTLLPVKSSKNSVKTPCTVVLTGMQALTLVYLGR